MTDSSKSLGALYAELGYGLFQAHRYQEAADALHKALAEQASDFPRVNVYLTLGKVYSARSKDQEALEAFSEALRLDPNTFHEAEEEILKVRNRITGRQAEKSAAQSPWDWLKSSLYRWFSGSLPIFRSMAFNLIDNGRFAEAETLLRGLVYWLPDDAEVQEKLGWALLKQEKVEKVRESVDVFTKAIGLDEERASAHRGLGEAYKHLGENRKAAEALRHALKLEPDDPSVLLLHGIVLRDLDEQIASEQALRHAIRLEPENQLLYRELAATLQAGHRTSEAACTLTEAAQLLLRKQDYKEAERLSKQAINLDPSSGPSYLTLGRAQMGQKRYDDALESLEKAADLDRTAEVSYEIARALFFRKSFLEALESVGQALASSSELAEALGLKGVILHRLGKPEEALLLLRESVAGNSKQAWFQAELGAVLESLKLPKEALAAYHQAIESDPKNRWAYNRMGLIWLDEQRYEDAASALKQALQLSPDDEAAFALEQGLQPSSESLLYTKYGEALYHLGKDEEAISAFDEALHHDPSNADASSLRGSALLRLRRYQEAVAAFQLTIDLDLALEREQRPSIYAKMGEALRMMNRSREAEEAFKKAIALDPNYRWALASYGELLRTLGKNKEAEEAFKKAIALEPDYQWALARYGETLRTMGKNKEAVECFQRGVVLNPSDSWAWGGLAAARMALGDHRSALEASEEAIKLDPNDASNWAYKSVILRLGRRYERAIEAIDKALQLDPLAAAVWVEKGIAIREMSGGGCDRALEVLEKATQLDEKSGYAWCQLAVCLYCVGRDREAIEALEKGVALDPKVTWVNALKALVLERLGQAAEAQRAYEQALGNLSNPQAYLDRGAIYAELGAHDRAVQDFQKALELDRKSADAYNSLAWLYLNSPEGDLEKATELAQRAVQLSHPPDGKILDTLGWIYFKRGMVEKAVPLLEQAARLAPEYLEIQDHLETCRQALCQRTSG